MILLFSQAVFSQFSEDLVTQLHSGTDAQMNSIDVAASKTSLFYNTSDDKIYYHDGSAWILLKKDEQSISGSSFVGDVLTIGIENGSSETVDLSGVKDNLGNHTATENLKLNGNYLSGDGGDEGVFVDNTGNVGVGTSSPNVLLEVNGKEQNTNVRVSISDDTELSTSSKTFIDLPGMSVDVTTADSDLLILLDIPGITNDAGDEEMLFIILVDGIQVDGMIDHEERVANYVWSSSLRVLQHVAAGTHTVKVQWRQQGWQNAHIGSINSDNSTYKFPRVLTVIEL